MLMATQVHHRQVQDGGPSSSMMVIPIKSDEKCDPPPQWTILELNGQLLLPKEQPPMDENNNNPFPLLASVNGKEQLELGKLWFENDGNKKIPMLIVGSHELKGKIEDLKEPFCMFSKQKSDAGTVSYTIQAVITQKLLFNQYPKSIMKNGA